jgi:hypothetical protein
MLRSLINGALRSRTGSRGGYGGQGGHSGGGYGGGRRGGGRNAMVATGVGMLANRFLRGRR